MKWKECARELDSAGVRDRFTWPGDVNGPAGFDCNPETTFNDFWGALSWLWTYPGDYLQNTHWVQRFFELDGTTVIGSSYSSGLSWLLLMILVAAFQRD